MPWVIWEFIKILEPVPLCDCFLFGINVIIIAGFN